jgi:hypothetical protein
MRMFLCANKDDTIQVTADHLDMKVGIDVCASNVRVVPPKRISLARAWL